MSNRGLTLADHFLSLAGTWPVVLLIAAGASTGTFMVLLALFGHPPLIAMQTLLAEGWSSTFALAETLVKAPPIIMCALAAAVPGRLRLLNIGAEGQFIVGSLAAAWAAVVFVSPWAMAVVAVLAGIAWAAVPGGLRAYLNVNETVTSLLMNYVAMFLLLFLIHGPWQDPAAPGWPQGALLPEGARLSSVVAGTRINILLPISILACVVVAIITRVSIVGVMWSVVAENPKTARMLSISPPKHILASFCCAGGLAALGGFVELAAIDGRLREGVSLNYGYVGLLVSWVARHDGFVIPLVGVIMAAVSTGADALQINVGLPLPTVQILIGLLLLGALLGECWYVAAQRTRTRRQAQHD